MPPISGDEALRRHREAIGIKQPPDSELSSLPVWQRMAFLGVGLAVLVAIVLLVLYISI